MAPQTIGRYQLLDLIGQGANSLVYRAHDPRFRRDVAIKLVTVPQSARQGDWQRRFERGIQAAGQLSHRHVAIYYDADVEDNQPYVVMELLSGGTLVDRFAQGSLSWHQACTLLLPLCQALSYAHQQGIIHRDVKPANVMFDGGGTLKLIDFGLARWRDDQNITQTDATRGTLAYMAPEQLNKKAGARSDIYALGIIFIEAITGQNVQIKGDLMQTVERLVSPEPVDLSALTGQAPPHLIDIIRRMVAKDPDQRYGDCARICQEIETLLAHATTQWQTHLETPVRLVNPNRLDLPTEASDILSHLFPKARYRQVEIDAEFGGGFSGSRVFLVCPVKRDGSQELPAVIKMAPLPLIQQELKAYEGCIQNMLPQIANIEGEAILPMHSTWGGLRYPLAGAGMREMRSFRRYYQQAPTEAIIHVLQDLFQGMGNIWLQNETRAGFRRQMSYDSLLPTNLLIQPMTPPPDAAVHRLHAGMVISYPLKSGQYVRLEGFIETERDEKTITLNLPPERGGTVQSYRVRLEKPDNGKIFSSGSIITGKILATRVDLLQGDIAETMGESYDVTAERLPTTDCDSIPNPLLHLPDLLQQRQRVKFSCIHGDLNLENILVNKNGRVRLIDFANARRDHVLHDFLRLETGFITLILPQVLGEAGLSPEIITSFYERLHCAIFYPHLPERTAVPHASLEKPFQILITIRQMARNYFYDRKDWTEYYRSLIIYLLGALKFKNLDEEDTAPLPKQIAFLGAAVLQKMLLTSPDCGPRQFGRYRVTGETGRGGMGVVYKAYDPRADRTVAIKALPRRWTNDQRFRELFDREIKMIANLEHEAIVPMHDTGEADGQLYLVMRHMTGGSLRDKLQAEGHLSLEETLTVFDRLAPALALAHTQGIIHRDIKPANILFNDQGKAFLADFGIARQAGSRLEIGRGLGQGLTEETVAYSSPEQIRGDMKLDARSDIYALGATLFMMLTGQPPYQAETPEDLAQMHLSAPVPNVRHHRPELPPACQNVIAQAMAKDPATRFSSVGQMEKRLQSVLAPQPKPVKRKEILPLPEVVSRPEDSKSVSDRLLLMAVWVVSAAIFLGMIILLVLYFKGYLIPTPAPIGTPMTVATPSTSTSPPTRTVPTSAAIPLPADDGTTYIIALDTSTTMEGQKLGAAVDAIADFVEKRSLQDEVVVYAFNDEVRMVLPLNRAVSVQASLDEALHDLQASGSTALYDAVCKVAEEAHTAQREDEGSGEVRSYKIVVLTDGPDTNSQKSESAMRIVCLPTDEWPERIRVFTIGYGEEADENSLTQMANRTNGGYFSAEPDNIAEILDFISRE